MEDRKLTERESLEIITKMIARTKSRYLDSGNILLMWGYLVTIISILIWALLATTHQNALNWLWFAIPLIGWPVSIIARRKRREYGAITYSDKITSRLWIIFGASQIVLTFICLGFTFFGDINCWSAMLVYGLLLAPGAGIAQGLIVKEKSLIVGSIISLAAGMVTLCCVVSGIPLSTYWYMPLFMLAWIAMTIVPGHILNHKAKHE